jgi:hypothetical protein
MKNQEYGQMQDDFDSEGDLEDYGILPIGLVFFIPIIIVGFFCYIGWH